ncbi:MAG: DUF3726 domain-containing protein [Paracoccaceae bacterium]
MSGPQDADLSLSELRALITKAARGAGMEWGLAEEAGWAAEWLARRGLPAADWAADWLADRNGGADCPVARGTAWADAVRAEGQGALGRSLPGGLAGPGFLLPFLHLCLAPGQSLSLRAPAGLAARIGDLGAVALGPAWSVPGGEWALAWGDEPVPGAAPCGRARVSAPVLGRLETLALRTTVPPTAASRGDAGSAVGDND